jgi:hypothetical protein
MRKIPIIVVTLLGFYNAYCALRGVNDLSLIEAIILAFAGGVLAVCTGYILWDQQRQNSRQTSLLTEHTESFNKLFVALGVRPEQPIELQVAQAIKTQLGNEAVKLSQEIFVLLGERHDVLPKPETWNSDVQASFDSSRKIMSQYDLRFSAMALSIRDRLAKLNLFEMPSKFGLAAERSGLFERPTNPLGVQEIANILGKTGHTLLAEADENVTRQIS